MGALFSRRPTFPEGSVEIDAMSLSYRRGAVSAVQNYGICQIGKVLFCSGAVWDISGCVSENRSVTTRHTDFSS